MQLMPSTAASLGVTDPYDPVQSINGGARYLREELDQFGGNTSLALAAYNAGGGAVARYGGIPPYPETQNYVSEILGRYQQLVAARGSA
jgi:soluble lytic murein transglycosylase-like protein